MSATDPAAQAELAETQEADLEPLTLLLLILAIGLATAGQLLLKAGMNEVGELSLDLQQIATLVRSVFTTWQLFVGLVAFGVSSVFWLLALSQVPLSTAYPMVSISYVLILGFSTAFLGERPGVTVWVGALLIMGGVSLIGIGQR